MTLVWLWMACGPKTIAHEMSDAIEAPSMAIDRPAGEVSGGLFTDDLHGFALPVLEGWVADAGPDSGLMRVAMIHVSTDTRVEFWVFPGASSEPRVREGCDWMFRAPARDLFGDQTVVSTCVPDDPKRRRIFGTVFPRGDVTMQVEVHPPNTALVEGREAGEVVLRSLRW